MTPVCLWRQLKTLGYEIDVNEKEAKVTIVGHGMQIPKQTADVYVGSAERRHVF